MSHLTGIVNAIIFIPSSSATDGFHARLAFAHIERRGYHLASIARTWTQALQVLCANEATVIVFADRDHFAPDWEPRVEFVGEETMRLVSGKPPRPGDDSGQRRPKRAA